MIKTQQAILRVDVKTADRLRFYQQEAANCWNQIVSVNITYYFGTHGQWIGKYELQQWVKGWHILHSQTVQALCDKFVANRLTTAVLRRQGLTKVKYPWREKRFMTIPFKQMAIQYSEANTLVLCLSAGDQFDTGVVPIGPVNTAEILWRKGRYLLSYTIEVPDVPLLEEGIAAGVDIGEIHPASICTQAGDALVVSGREIRAAKQFRNKALGELTRLIGRCRNGSRRWRKLVAAKKWLMAKTEAQIKDLIHKATRKVIHFCVQHGVKELVIGDLRGVEQKTKKTRRLNRAARQKVGQMEYGRITRYLEYKAEEKGIRTCLVNERCTSQTCPRCHEVHVAKGRVYRCAGCGYEEHRDVKGAFMILRKVYPDQRLVQFKTLHQQASARYRKCPQRAACVDGSDVAQVAWRQQSISSAGRVSA